MRSTTRRTGFVGEDADLAVHLAHRIGEVLGHHGRLIARLEEQIGRKEAVRALFDDHHRVPVVDVRRLEEAQRVPPEGEPLAVLKAAHAFRDAEAARVELNRQRRAHQFGLGRRVQEAIHPAVLVPSQCSSPT